MQVSVIDSHDAEILGKKQTLPYILRIKLTNITLKYEKNVNSTKRAK